MSRFARLAIVAVVGSALAAGPVAAALAQDNAAVAVNTKDGTSIFRLAFSVRHVMGDVVDETNAAVAFASCESCQTVAVAIQVVLVMGDPSVVTPTNVAIALNENCTSCETLASAVQYVLGVGGPVHFSAAGNQALAALRNDLRDLLAAGLSIDELAPALDDLTSRLGDILATELVAAGKPDDAPEASASPAPPEATPETAPSSEPTPESVESTTTPGASEPPPSPASETSPSEAPAPSSSP